MGLSFLCYAELGSFNLVRAGFGLVRIMTGTDDIVQIASFPEKTYLVTPDGGYGLFRDYLESQGCTLVEGEQLGAQFPVEKDGVREYVYWSSNGYFQKWQWG